MKNVFVIAGESSGDMHGAGLVEEVRRIDPTIRFRGLGGPKLAGAGAELLADITQHAAVGVMEALRNARHLVSAYYLVSRKLREERPDAIVLIDFPDFNLRIARKARRLGIRVVYYISPQVWAWRTGRVRQIARRVDRMLVILPFEVDFYAKRGIQAEFVGHPLVDRLAKRPGRAAARERLGLDPNGLVIGLLPGSRKKEIDRLLPIMLRAAERLRADRPGTRFIIGAAPGHEPLIRQIAAGHDVQVVDNDTYAAMAASDLVLIASGTATVEAMILNVPMVVTYRVSLGTYIASAWMMKLDRFAMPNIIAGRPIVPELMQWQATAEKLYREASALLAEGRLEQMRIDLAAAAAKLGGGGASARAAEKLVEELGGR